MNVVTVKNLDYAYQDGSSRNRVLREINVSFEEGKFYTIVGESGSGKTTLLSLMSGLDEIQEGNIYYEDKKINKIGYTKFRNKYVNIVFQAYNLITYMTAYENIKVAMDIKKVKTENKKEYIYSLLEKVGLDQDKADRQVLKLSGGEQQRVAIARALVQDTKLIMADEPTGNLDERTASSIIKIFKDLAKEGKCVIIVTHSNKIANQSDVVYRIKEGKIEVPSS